MRAPFTTLVQVKFAILPLVAALGACGGGNRLASSPPPEAPGLACRDAYVIGSVLDQPERVQVWNATQGDMRIALDECGRQRHLGWVKGGAVAVFVLPERLVQFSDGLRFHAYPMDANRESRTIAVEPGSLVPRLVITAEG